MIFPNRPYNNPAHIVFAAKDPVGIPTDPAVTKIVEKALCHVSLGHNCYVLTSVYGEMAEVPYGALLEDWERIAYGLLSKALART